MASSEDPDEKAHFEPSHQDLHCLHRYLYPSTGLKGLREMDTLSGAGAWGGMGITMLIFFSLSSENNHYQYIPSHPNSETLNEYFDNICLIFIRKG